MYAQATRVSRCNGNIAGWDDSGAEGVANDFSKILELEREAMNDWSPNLPISIVIPVYNRAEILSKTLAMITHQSYPLDLIEVVIADDGSQEDILAVADLFRDRLTITYVNQDDQGFRAAAARNMGSFF